MFILSITEVLAFLPVPRTEEEKRPGETYIRFHGDHPNNPEQGSIRFKAQLLSGQADNSCSMVAIWALERVNGTLRSWQEEAPGTYILEVWINNIYANGLKYSLQNTIVAGGYVLGLSPADQSQWFQREGQLRLLEQLSSAFMPERSREIVALARPAVLLQDPEQFGANATEDTTVVHIWQIEPEEGKMNIATLDVREFSALLPVSVPAPFLSFSIDPDAHTSTPGVRFLDNLSDQTILQESVFHAFLLMDIPKMDHSILETLELDDDELDQYETLESLYKTLIYPFVEDAEINKWMGYPDNIQHCVAMEAQNLAQIAHGISGEASDWQLYLQISPYCKWFDFYDEFGDATLYLMMKEDDWAEQRFEHAVCVGQCT